jgi:hypothetical protein
MRRAGTLLSILAIALAGCGGGSSPADDAKSTLKSYLDAFVNGDGAKACGLMSKGTRDQFVSRVKVLTKTTDCTKAITTIRAAAGAPAIDALKKTKISDVKVDGDTATAKLASGSGSTTTVLKKEGGDWKITAIPGTQ